MPDETSERVKRIVDVGIEFGTAFGADIVSRLMFPDRRPGDQMVIEQVAKLAREGKKEEARELLRARPGGFGQVDEMILESDLLAIKARAGQPGWPTVNQVDALAAYLASRTPEQRRKFRHGHVAEQKHEIRYRNLVELAKLPNNNARRQYLWAAGTFDLSGLERFDRSFVKPNKDLDRAAKRLLREIRTNAGRRARFDFLMPWRWKFLNPLR